MKGLEVWTVVAAMVGMAAGPALGAPESGSWREARGMPRGTGQDIVRVRTPEAGALAASPTIQLEYALPALKVVKEPGVADGQSVLVLGNAPVAGDAGKPMLPVVPCYVALPAGSELDSVEVVCGKETKLAGRHVIPQGQKPIPLLKDAKGATSAKATAAEEPTAPDAAVYGSDEPWPKARHEVVTVQKKRGMSVLVVNLNPVVYRPKSGDVSYYETMELRVKTRSTASASSPQAGSGQARAKTGSTGSPQAAVLGGEGPVVQVREDTIRPLTEQVDNPATVETYKAAMKK